MANQQKVVEDVQGLLRAVSEGDTVDVPDEVRRALGEVIAERFVAALEGRERRPRRKDKKLHFSEVGHPCRRKVWYNVNRPELAERTSPSVIFKFLYGDLIEELYLALVRLSGHEVTDEQKRCEIELTNGWTITGRLDAKIDGDVTDVKSASTFSFRKFEDGLTEDAFGYHGQLRGYCEAEGDKEGSFHVIDKTLGHITQTTMKYEPMTSTEKQRLVDDIDRDDPPPRAFDPEPEGKSGNLKLGINCSYCPFKHECWKDSNGGKGIRTFMYSNKPVFLVKVEREPRVPEYMGK